VAARHKSFAARRVLIYRLGSLGDTIVSLPALHLVASAFPDAQRILLTASAVGSKAPPAAAILGDQNLVHGYIEYPLGTRKPSDIAHLVRHIREMQFDVLVYLAASRGLPTVIRDAIFFTLCGIRRIIGLPLSLDRRRNRIDSDTGTLEYEASRLCRCISDLGAVDLDDVNSWNLFLSADETANAARAVSGWAYAKTFITASIGTKVDVKDWGHHNWRGMLDAVQRRYPTIGLVVLGAADEHAASAEVTRSWGVRALNLCGQISPREAAALLAQSRLFVGHDSGPAHLAATAGVPVIAIFSARNKPRVWFPYGRDHRVIYHQTECYGCNLSVCTRYQKKCITSISVDEVLEQISQVLESRGISARQEAQGAL
jgi:heptosyltransferase III